MLVPNQHVSQHLGALYRVVMSIENYEILTHTIELYMAEVHSIAVKEGREPPFEFRVIMLELAELKEREQYGQRCSRSFNKGLDPIELLGVRRTSQNSFIARL